MFKKIIFLLILFIVCLGISPLFGQKTTEEIEAEKRAAARQAADEFARNREITAQDRIVDPDFYIVGPGDELTVFYYGPQTNQYELTITPEGSVLIPEFGEVHLGQIALTEARRKILEALAERYHNIPISVTLSSVRKLKVSVDGEVFFPGMYTVTSMDRVTEAISLAGGLRDQGSQRNIRILRNGGLILADLLSFARGGEDSRNPYLLEGDKIYVPPRQMSNGLVEIYGSIKSPGKYEFVTGEKISDLIMLAGGLLIDANPKSAELVRFEDHVDSTFTLQIDIESILNDPGSFQNLTLLPDDRLFIRAIPDYHRKAQVTLEGEVVYPGVYAIREDTTTLAEVIAQAGGFTPQASLEEARMYRSGYEAIKDTELDRQIKLSIDQLSDIEREYLLLKSSPDQGQVSIDFIELFVNGDSTFNISLKGGDRIIIPRKSYSVRIMGRVLKPGLVAFRDGAGVDYYIGKSGGLVKSADRGKIRIIKSSSGSIVKPSSKVKIEIGDEILVPEKQDTDWWQVTKDIGLFLANLATVYIVVDQIVE